MRGGVTIKPPTHA